MSTDKPSRKLLFATLLGRSDFLLSVPAGMLLLATAYYWLLLKVSTLETAIGNISLEPLYLNAVLFLAPLTLLLFGLNLGLAIFLFRVGGGLRWQGGSLLGAFTGGFAAACPVCGAFLLSLVGVTAGLTALPFAGLEVWAGSSLIMGFTFYKSLDSLDKKTCDPSSGTAACWRLPKVDPRHISILLLLVFVLFVNLYTMLLKNEPSLRTRLSPLRFASSVTGFEMNTQRELSESAIGSPLVDEIREKVLPEEGVTLPIRWGDWVPKLVEAGVIDLAKFEESLGPEGLTEEQEKLLREGSNDFITVNNENSWFTVMVFWPLGLANKTDINRASPINDESLFNFASTGGWTLGKEENGGAYFNKFELVKLTPEQEQLVKVLGENSYRPCCNNSTFFQDCNHGSGLLGLLELGASQGLSREELAKAVLVANSYWFPHNYLQTAIYMKEVKGVEWEDVSAEEVLGFDYSSATGANKVTQELAQRNLIPQSPSGAQCGV